MSDIREKLSTIKTFIRDIADILNKCERNPHEQNKYIEQIKILEQYALKFNEHKIPTNNNEDNIKQIESRMIVPENISKIQTMLNNTYKSIHNKSIITIYYNISRMEYYQI